MKEKVAQFAKQYLKEDVPEFKVGDTVAASVRIIEGTKERVQVFQGVCIARRHAGIDETFTIRKISFQVGVERTFFLNSPRLAGLEVKRRGRVRRSKLYYLRDRVGKARRVKELRVFRDK